ncbi:unnamed protein product [Cuscuta campestris]|uniref:Leucine-rich repeat-containing N-terminal plant-type domain-containing protein n=1 Tax=Cuscuta campestris TaxID=132261 RepID=A0A484LBE1_9ASTE|nr:unnamed protein product [Cuscuta campestris]
MSPSSPLSSLEKKRCHDDEMDALLQFKHTFLNTNHFVEHVGGYVLRHCVSKPKLESWEEGRDCCSWEGVECDEQDDHHVVGLYLRNSCLYGSINSSSSLFTLTHLQRLDLSWNDFNSSHIPSAIGNLSRLTHLNLEGSKFGGRIPQQQLSKITTMVSLDLSSNFGLEVGSLKGLVQYMIHLKELHLSYVNIASSDLPRDLLSNFSSLESLDLYECGLKGEFPVAIFNLPKLKKLNLSRNADLKGYLPNFRSGSPLTSLRLDHTSFGGVASFHWESRLFGRYRAQSLQFYREASKVTCLTTSSLSWIGELTSLTKLTLGGMNLKGEIPSWLMNLTRLTHLYINDNQLIDFSSNNFEGQIPDAFGEIAGLHLLNLSRNHLGGHIPSSFSNMKSLECLDLSQNKLSGQIPIELAELNFLSLFNVSYNNLSGPIPQGKQFCTYDSTSYEGNPRLFIEPWSKQCGNARSLPQMQQPLSPTNEDDDSESGFKIKWMIISIGIVGGLVVGVILGNELIARKQYWFVKTLARIGIR